MSMTTPILTAIEQCCHCGLYHRSRGTMEETPRRDVLNQIRKCGQQRALAGLKDERPELPDADSLAEADHADR